MRTDVLFAIFAFFPIASALAKIFEINGYAINAFVSELTPAEKVQNPFTGCAGLTLILWLGLTALAAIAWNFFGYMYYDQFIFLLGIAQQLVFATLGFLYIPSKVTKAARTDTTFRQVKRFTALNGILQLSITIYALASL